MMMAPAMRLASNTWILQRSLRCFTSRYRPSFLFSKVVLVGNVVSECPSRCFSTSFAEPNQPLILTCSDESEGEDQSDDESEGGDENGDGIFTSPFLRTVRHERPGGQFCMITRDELEEIVLSRGFRQTRRRGTVELVYEKRKKAVCDNGNVVVRLFSSIDPDGFGRDCGKDTIRIVHLLYKDKQCIGPLSKCENIRRTNNWRKNLTAKLDDFDDKLEKIEMGYLCQTCGCPMILRSRKDGKRSFYGCSGYGLTRCNFTMPYNSNSDKEQ
jgi:hypothetical protein